MTCSSAGTLLLHLAGKGHIYQKAKSTFHRWFQGAAVKQNNRCSPTHTALIVSLESHSHTEGLTVSQSSQGVDLMSQVLSVSPPPASTPPAPFTSLLPPSLNINASACMHDCSVRNPTSHAEPTIFMARSVKANQNNPQHRNPREYGNHAQAPSSCRQPRLQTRRSYFFR